jgi:hypothetical protein
VSARNVVFAARNIRLTRNRFVTPGTVLNNNVGGRSLYCDSPLTMDALPKHVANL